MLYSYLKVVIRNFFSDGMYTAIIVIGLAVGIAVSLIIGQYIYFELSFDKQYKDRDRIYYTYMIWQDENGVYDMKCHPAISPLIKKTIPEVENSIRIVPSGLTRGDEWVLRRELPGETKDFGRINNMYSADPEIFDFFSIPMLGGDPKTALVDPHSVVITKSIADKFFPGESPLDKTLKVLTYEFKVTGVIADPLPNTTLQYNVLFSMNIIPVLDKNLDLERMWTYPMWQTFVKLSPSSDKKSIEEKINKSAEAHFSLLQKQYDIVESVHLLPFRDFHFYTPRTSSGISTVRFTGDRRILGFFAALAFLILIICWANYINLTIARALRRAKEVGLRKVSGAGKSNLIVQFLSEFLFLNIISLLVAFTITQFTFNPFASAIGSKAQWLLWKEPWFWIALAAFVIISTMVSGIYPALVMSGYNPIKVLKGNFSRSQSGMTLRRTLVLVQFGFSAFLLMSIYVISRQLFFMQTKDLGMTTEQVLILRLDELDSSVNRHDAFDRWKTKTRNFDHVVSTASSSNFPGSNVSEENQYYSNRDPQRRVVTVEYSNITADYFQTFDILFVSGRSFKDESGADSGSVIINETAAKQLGFENAEAAVGQNITNVMVNLKFQIIGVVHDFTASVKEPADGLVFHNIDSLFLGYFVVRLSTTNLPAAMDELEAEWKTLFNTPFDYLFLDTYFDTFYKEERQFAGVFGFFSIVGVVITCMGLFGLSMYNTHSRTKEIGIRKSLGSSSRGIMWLLSKEYLNLVLIAGIISIPVGAWLLSNWLKNYPQRIEFGADFIVAPLILMILIALFTVGYQTYKAAHSNPVNSLRNE